MAIEIERKFLVVGDAYREAAVRILHIEQGYLSRDPERTVRVRVRDDKGFLTVKGVTDGATREEYEYEVPVDDARRMLRLALPGVIAKTRYIVDYAGHRWEIDEFHGDRAPLVVAEIELESEDAEFNLPPYIGEEVTGNPRYYNSNM